MVARTRSELGSLVVVERDGEEPVRVAVIHSEIGLTRVLTIPVAHSALHIGDRLRVETAE
jgi:hypothetical protein